MLIDFAVQNYGPFRDRALLSMISMPSKEHPEYRVEGYMDDGVLTSAVIVAPNAAGKTQFFEAMQTLVTLTSRSFDPGYEYPWYNPFRLSSKTASAPVELRIRFMEDGVIYDYDLAFSKDRIVTESLYHSPNGRRARIFERTVADESQDFKGANSAMVGFTNPNTTYLYVAAHFNDPVCEKVWNLIQSVHVIGTHGVPPVSEINRFLKERITKDPQFVSQVVRIMDYADFRISDLIIQGTFYTFPHETVMVRHDHPEADVDQDKLLFPLDRESTGTLQMLHLAAHLADVLRNGGVFVMDGIDTFLHWDVAVWMIRQFREFMNPNHAQLVVNTHNPLFLDIEELLRRDQIYFINKSFRTGASDIYGLVAFRGVRKDTNVQAAYSMGRYEAQPSVINLGVIM